MAQITPNDLQNKIDQAKEIREKAPNADSTERLAELLQKVDQQHADLRAMAKSANPKPQETDE